MGFPRQEYWSGFPCRPPGDIPDPGIEPLSPVAPPQQAGSLLLSHRESPVRGAERLLIIQGKGKILDEASRV